MTPGYVVSILCVVAVIVASLSGVIGLGLILSFLRHVYDRGGAVDLLKAARAIREARGPSSSTMRSSQLSDEVTTLL
jgi:hypothetical protein